MPPVWQKIFIRALTNQFTKLEFALAGRGNQLNPQLLEKFKQFSLENGILPENIAILPQNGRVAQIYRCHS